MKTINYTKFKELIERETALRDNSPEHTLDWYTYNNKVELLKETDALISEHTCIHQKEVKEVSQPTPKQVRRVVDKTKDTDTQEVTEK